MLDKFIGCQLEPQQTGDLQIEALRLRCGYLELSWGVPQVLIHRYGTHGHVFIHSYGYAHGETCTEHGSLNIHMARCHLRDLADTVSPKRIWGCVHLRSWTMNL